MKFAGKLGCAAVLVCVTAPFWAVGSAFGAQDPASATNQGQSGQSNQAPANPAQPNPETRMTPAQAKDLFASVDAIMKFASDDTKLPIRSKIKRRLTSRDAVEKYLLDKTKNDKDAKRMQRSEIVLKKFGMLDEDFHLQPFLISLLKEQIAGYYDSKTRTVNLLDWIPPDNQKPVLAHELTHALQDQYIDHKHQNFENWEDPASEAIARNAIEDNQHISQDEAGTAREAVLEGQAMAVLVDYGLKPQGQTILSNPQEVKQRADDQGADSDSPVLSRAPLVLEESLLFPYREGLKFEVDLLKDTGTDAAFAGALDRPPTTSLEILDPKVYERQPKLPLLKMPDLHPLIDAEYDPYDVGVMGALDVRMLAELFGGQQMAANLAQQWDGGIYYAAQKKSAPDKSLTSSIGLLYLSQWKTPVAAAAFAHMYADEFGRQYSNVKRDKQAESDPNERVFQSNEGTLLIAVSGSSVFLSESFDLALARKIQFLMLGAQQGSTDGQSVASVVSGVDPSEDLTGSMVHFLSNCGVMRAALPR